MIKIEENLKLEITRDCNLECEHCYKGEKENKYMSLETIDKVFKDVDEIGCLMISGGEPFLALPQLERVYEQISKNNIKVWLMVIQSNCTIMNDRVVEILAKLSKVVEYCYVTTLTDSFKRMEIISKGLKLDSDKTTSYLEENNYLRLLNVNNDSKKIYKVGRASNLTEDDMIRANNNSADGINYSLVDESEYYESRSLYNSPTAKDNSIFRTVYVTVDGNLCSVTPTQHTYAEEDMMIEANINDYSNIYDAVSSINPLTSSEKVRKIFKR